MRISGHLHVIRWNSLIQKGFKMSEKLTILKKEKPKNTSEKWVNLTRNYNRDVSKTLEEDTSNVILLTLLNVINDLAFIVNNKEKALEKVGRLSPNTPCPEKAQGGFTMAIFDDMMDEAHQFAKKNENIPNRIVSLYLEPLIHLLEHGEFDSNQQVEDTLFYYEAFFQVKVQANM